MVRRLTTENGLTLTPVQGRIVGYEFTLTEHGFTPVEQVVLDGVGARSAADGESLAVLAYDYAGKEPGTASYRAQGEVGAPTATLVVDGRRTTLLDAVVEGEGQLLALSVPATASHIELELAQAGVTQTLDLRSGELAAGAPEVNYRPGNRRTAKGGFSWLRSDVNKSFSLPFRLSDGLFDGTYPTEVTVMAMDLQYWYGPSLTASAADRALLIPIVDVLGGNTWKGTLPADRLTLTDAEGHRYKAKSRSARKTDEVNLFESGDLYFDVPADITSGVVTMSPGSLSVNGTFFRSLKLQYRQERAQWRFDFT